MSRSEKYINELVSLAKELCPNAEITISTTPWEQEDGRVKVIVPSEKFDEVDEALLRRSNQILLEEGHDILTIVYDREELASRMAA